MPHCEVCGTLFYAVRSDQRYCHKKCNRKASNKRKTEKKAHTKPCQICGRAFRRKNGWDTRCSACRAALVNPKNRFTLISCEYCGELRIVKDRKARFCGGSCAKKAYYAGQDTREYPILRERCKRRCATCGEPTNNYRCDSCWQAIRGEGDAMEAIDFGAELAM